MNLAYRYHCRAPIAGLEHAMAEHARCVQLWNRLVDIDREFNRRIEEATAEAIPEGREALDEVHLLSEGMKGARRKDRKELAKARWQARKRLREAVKQWRREHKEEVKRLNQERNEAVKSARQAVTVNATGDERMYWPNSNSVLARYEAARQATRKKGRRVRYHDDSREDGVLTVQIQSTRSGLGAAPDELTSLSMVKLTGSRLVMRVDAAGHTLELPITYHRPLPECRVKGVQVCWRKAGIETEWWAVFQLAGVPTEKTAYRRRGELRLCWEMNGEGLIVARPSWREPYKLPADWLARADRLEDQLSWLDNSLNEQIEAADGDVAGLLDRPKLAVYGLRREDLPAELHGWLRSWRRTWWQTHHGRRKLLGHRRYMYQQWAREIVRECPDLVIDDVQLDRVAREDKDTQSNRLRQRACVHSLRAEIVHQANKIGASVTDASGKVLTLTEDKKTSAWARRKAKKQERSQEEEKHLDQ